MRTTAKPHTPHRPPTKAKNIPKPPKPPRPLEMRSFAKLIASRVYLLDGHSTNPFEEDTQERFESRVVELKESGKTEVQAKILATKERCERFGYGEDASHGYYGQPVRPWFPGNFAVLLKPIKQEHSMQYLNLHGESLELVVARVLFLMHHQYLLMFKPEEVQPLETDELGGIKIPGLGVLYGTLESAQAEITAFVLSRHGRVTGKTALGEYEVEQVSEEQVLAQMPFGFTNMLADEETKSQVFDEVLTVSTLFNPELVARELLDDGEVEDDEVKN